MSAPQVNAATVVGKGLVDALRARFEIFDQLKGSGAALGVLALSDACRSLELKAKQTAQAPVSTDELDRLAEIAAASQSELRVQLLAA
jgi:HPt (histidine-containing phosphotransfer) domain-containing protein